MSGRALAVRRMTTTAAVGALATFVYFHGFDCASWFREAEAVIVTTLLGMFTCGAWIGWRGRASSDHALPQLAEPVFTSIVAMASIYRVWLGYVGQRPDPSHVELLAVHTALLVLAGITIAREVARPLSDRMLRLHPAVAFAVSYVVLSLFGACLLMLPEMTATGQSMGPLDAVFTSISASCVTGLAVVDTATHFSVKGQAVILLLIQLGGLNVISFATYFLIYGAGAVPPDADRAEVEEYLHADARSHLYRTLAFTAAVSVAIEFAAAVVIYVGWGEILPDNQGAGAFFSALFHSVSAFNNAGFSIHTGGLTNASLQSALGLHAVVAGLIVLGGLGVPVLSAITRGTRDAASRVAVTWGAMLLVVGAVGYWALERDGTLAGASGVTSTATAVFQSVTARTAGFSTVDMASLSSGTLALLAVLMFVGASTGSTGGGIKTSTAAVLAAGAAGFFRRKGPLLLGRPLSQEVMRKALSIAVLAAITILAGTAALVWVEPGTPFRDLVFEEVSAFGTVGLSTGVTPRLSAGGKGVVMTTILIGRIGPLGLGLSLLGSRLRRGIRHADFLVG